MNYNCATPECTEVLPFRCCVFGRVGSSAVYIVCACVGLCECVVPLSKICVLGPCVRAWYSGRAIPHSRMFICRHDRGAVEVRHRTMLALAASLPAFSPAAAAPALSPARASSPMMVERSQSIPFLKKPPALDGEHPATNEAALPRWPSCSGPVVVLAISRAARALAIPHRINGGRRGF